MKERIKHGDIGYSYEIHPHEPAGYFYLIYFNNESLPCAESDEWYETKKDAIHAAEGHITTRCENGER